MAMDWDVEDMVHMPGARTSATDPPRFAVVHARLCDVIPHLPQCNYEGLYLGVDATGEPCTLIYGHDSLGATMVHILDRFTRAGLPVELLHYGD